MSYHEKKQKKKKPTCIADLVTDVPNIIRNDRKGITYDCLQFLGSGSYGKCYEVAKRPKDVRFACKVLSRTILEDNDLRRLVQNEISIHRKLKHEHVVNFIESFEDDKHIFMILSLCSNYSLRDLQHAIQEFSLSDCRYIISQILKGVQYIHEQGVIHRDIKVTNILIDDSMQMKLGDFGLAIRAEDGRIRSRSLCGTTNYLAPEIINRQGFRFCSDVWAVGVIAYVISHGYKPFEDVNTYRTYERIKRVDFTLKRNLNPEYRSLIRSIFVDDVELRLSAADCLKQDFFTKHKIPFSIKPFERESFTDKNEPSCIMEYNLSKFEQIPELIHKEIQYPSIVFVAELTLESTFKNYKYAEKMSQAFHRFDAICQFHDIESGFDISDFSNSDDADHPEYWVTKWSYEKTNDSGFVYQISDGSNGMLFYSGFKLMLTPDNTYWSLLPGDEKFKPVCDIYDDSLSRPLLKFCWFNGELSKNSGSLITKTPYNHRKLTYVYSWMQTDEAMIMLLSNMTLQINFTRTHKKMLICLKNETITFFKGNKGEFRTVTLSKISSHGFSKISFNLLKYITAIIKHLSDELYKESGMC